MYTIYFIYDFVKKLIVYVGITDNLKIRIQQHVDGNSNLKLTVEDLKNLNFYNFNYKMIKESGEFLEWFLQDKLTPKFNFSHENKRRFMTKSVPNSFFNILNELNFLSFLKINQNVYSEYTSFTIKSNRNISFLDYEIFIRDYKYETGLISSEISDSSKPSVAKLLSSYSYKELNKIFNLNFSKERYIKIKNDFYFSGSYNKGV